MRKDIILYYLKYAIKNNSPLKIKTKNNKLMKVKIINFTNGEVQYSFLNNSSNKGMIHLENIISVDFIKKEDDKEFKYELLSIKYNSKNLKNHIETLEKYYLELIDILLEKEKKNPEGYWNLKVKKKIYPKIFENLVQDYENLLFYYFSKKDVKMKRSNNLDESKKEILLIEQANLSQKEALGNALNERVYVIEGPPGTGKTTTILNILANLVYQNKKVLVVSKNNSAIENVVEELQNMDIPKCYIRMGNSNKIMKEQLEPNIEDILFNLREDLDGKSKEELLTDKEELINIIEELDEKENELNQLIEKRNELQELKNQLRHVEKKSTAYDLKQYEYKIMKKYKRLTPLKLKKTITFLAKILIILEEKNKIRILDKIVSYFLLKMNKEKLENDGIAIHILLEEYYLTSLIKESEKELEKENFEKLKEEINDIYLKKYIPISKKILNNVIKNNIDIELLEKTIDKVIKNKDVKPSEENETPKINAVKDDLLNLYPIVLTTVDSMTSNYRSYFNSNKKIDYIIIDEASQCDILSALPILHLAKNLIVVGDDKQLGAIVNIDQNLLHYKVEDEYDYSKQNFLSTIIKTMLPVSKMLLEHYRCDYNIINYCNKYFYKNKLKIYNDSKKGAMSIIDGDKGKYVEIDNGYKNEREIKTIDEQINSNIDNKFIITPFRLQADILKKRYGEERCGTIHTFQGKGEKQVYFSAVLNNTKKCIYHLNGPNNLFSKELINVAVSRAKDKFVLVVDKEFFKKNDENMKNLIEYIEVYGDTIPDKTVCIFDYLYKEISSYKKVIENIDNPYEEKVYYLILDFIKKSKDKYDMVCKLPLAEFVSDKKFLEDNDELKRFVLNNSHLDFAIYSKNINKPILAIEVDGKSHQSEEQKKRDEKKEKILNHMDIPLLRIKSKSTLDNDDFIQEIEKYIRN